MKKLLLILAVLGCYRVTVAQDVINPYADTNTSVPDFVDFVESHDLTKMNGDTVTLNIVFVKKPYHRNDAKWGSIEGDIYMTYSELTYYGKEQNSQKQLFYLRDYKNNKPTRFTLHTQQEMENIISNASESLIQKTHYFFRPEKFTIRIDTIDNKTLVTLKRVYIPQYITIDPK